jgi:ubiquinone/menaquinone biosynthesis C-methylase UbiE
MNSDILGSLDKSRTYERKGVVWLAWPEEMGSLAKAEAAYHDKFDEDAIEVHQLGTWRNRFYHGLLQQKLRNIPKGGRILEIGAGSGLDAQDLAPDYNLVLSDISSGTLDRLAKRLNNFDITYVAADGQRLPFVDSYFDGLLMVAAWHHLESPAEGIIEVARVMKPGGQLVIGVEPNVFYFYPMKIVRPILSCLANMKGKDVSHADEEMVGFSYRKIKQIFNSSQWTDLEIRPMWLFAGWVHYALEFVYRVFRLKKRIRLPLVFEKVIVGLDEVLFKIPFTKHICWHWMISAKRKE